MGRKSRRKWERRGPAEMKDDYNTANDVQEWTRGPISVSLRGKTVGLRSHWKDPGDYQRFLERLRKYRQELKVQIDEEIQKLVTYIHSLDRLTLMGAIATELQAVSEDEFGEDSSAKFAHAEYFMSLALAEPLPESPRRPTLEDVKYVLRISDNIMKSVTNYYGFEAPEQGEEGSILQLKLMMRLHTLLVRGEAYPQHTKELTLRLLRVAEPFFVKHFSLTADSVWSILEGVVNKISQRLTELTRKARETLLKSSTSQGTFDDLLVRMLDVYKYVPAVPGEAKLVELLSAQFGDNSDFTSAPPEWRGWPLNPSIIYDRPFVKHGGQYYAFLAPRLLSDTPHILERLIQRTDHEYYEKSFVRRRAHLLEEYALELLRGALQPETVASNLFYTPPGEKTTELDGVITLGEALLLVEAKAGQIRDASRRGAPRGLREDVEKLIGEAFSQGQRALAYIDSVPEAIFTDKNGNIVRIRGTEFTFRFIINVTMSPLFVLGTSLPSLKDIGALKGNGWPWAVYICDLAAIAELTTHPIELLHYIKKRMEANRPDVSNVDELDLYGYYLETGTCHIPDQLPNSYSIKTLHGYTRRIDEYFYYKAGIKSKRVPKPKQELPLPLDTLLTRLEHVRPPGYVTVGLALLDLDRRSRATLGECIHRLDKKYCKERKLWTEFVTTDAVTFLLAVGPGLPDEHTVNTWTKEWTVAAPKGKSLVIVAWAGRLRNTSQMLVKTVESNA